MSDQEIARALILLFGALSVADSVLTYFGLRYGRVEGNPIGRFLLRHGPIMGYGSKLSITALMCLGFLYIAGLMPMATLITIGIIVLAYAVVIIKNAIALAPLCFCLTGRNNSVRVQGCLGKRRHLRTDNPIRLPY